MFDIELPSPRLLLDNCSSKQTSHHHLQLHASNNECAFASTTLSARREQIAQVPDVVALRRPLLADHDILVSRRHLAPSSDEGTGNADAAIATALQRSMALDHSACLRHDDLWSVEPDARELDCARSCRASLAHARSGWVCAQTATLNVCWMKTLMTTYLPGRG